MVAVARSLVQDYVYMNVKKEMGIPDDAEVDFIMKPEITLSVQERKDLMDKQCEEITGDYQLVNYFVMRCVGQDFEAARYLSAGHMNFAALSGYMPSTLLRNSVELTGSDFNAGKKDNFRTAWTYRCQSLIEDRGSYFVMTSRVTVEDLKVIDFKVVDRERISPREADMMTKREEYVILHPWYFSRYMHV